MIIQYNNSIIFTIYTIVIALNSIFLLILTALFGYREGFKNIVLPGWVTGPVAHFLYVSAGVTVLIFLGARRL